MKNHVQVGHVVTIPAPADVSSGDIVAVGALIGVAAGDAASGDDLDLTLVGVFDLPKVSTDSVAIGDVLYFDSANAVVTLDDDSGANARIGVATTAAGNPSATINVRLDG